MAKPRWFRFFGMDFLGSRKVVAMNTPQRGAYMQLLVLEWDDSECSLPKNPDHLKAMAGWSNAPESWGSFEPVIACFTTHPKYRNRVHNARLYEEWKYCQEKSSAAQESAKARWSKPTVPEQPVQKIRKPPGGFESVGSIADKHFKPV